MCLLQFTSKNDKKDTRIIMGTSGCDETLKIVCGDSSNHAKFHISARKRLHRRLNRSSLRTKWCDVSIIALFWKGIQQNMRRKGRRNRKK